MKTLLTVSAVYSAVLSPSLMVFVSLPTGMFVTIFALTTHTNVKFSFVWVYSLQLRLQLLISSLVEVQLLLVAILVGFLSITNLIANKMFNANFQKAIKTGVNSMIYAWMVRIMSHQSFFLSLFHHLNRQLEVRYLMESSGFGCVIVMCTNFHCSFELFFNVVYTSQQNIPLLFVDILVSPSSPCPPPAVLHAYDEPGFEDWYSKLCDFMKLMWFEGQPQFSMSKVRTNLKVNMFPIWYVICTIIVHG